MADHLRAPKFFHIFIIAICSLAILLAAVPGHANDNEETAGDIMLAVVPAVAYGMTFKFDDKDGRMQFYKSLLSTAAVTYGLKKTVSSNRPNGKDNESFPSGHTSITFSSAAFIQKRYGWEYGLPAYAAAAFTGWSRVGSDNHHVRDVLAGALIGTASAQWFTTPLKGEMRVSPVIGNRMYGLVIQGKW